MKQSSLILVLKSYKFNIRLLIMKMGKAQHELEQGVKDQKKLNQIATIEKTHHKIITLKEKIEWARRMIHYAKENDIRKNNLNKKGDLVHHPFSCLKTMKL